jgi:hypothetical protein
LSRSGITRSAALLAVSAVLALGCAAQPPAASPTPAATATHTPTSTARPSPTSQATLAPVEDGTAAVVTTGDVATSVTLPYDRETSEFPTGDGSFDLRWQDAELNTLAVTLDITGGQVTSAFVGVGVPGTVIDDDTYFADFFRLQCDVQVTLLDAAGVEGTFDCPGLENGAGTQTIDATGAFSAIP